MNITNEKLYEIAEGARVNAYAPFSNFCVGAALLTKDGELFTGVNIENSSYGATICAERVAFVKAISEGKREFAKIAISAGDEESVPCGICRQFMYEFSPEIEVITKASPKDGGELKVRPLTALLPEGFVLERS